MGFSSNWANSFPDRRVLPIPRGDPAVFAVYGENGKWAKPTNPYESTGITEVRIVVG
jgi:hypothetical protein